MTVTGRSPKRFTLVELLFVIGIIMILMSLLLPALRSAKEHGRRTVCTAQERQIALGYNAYADDYNDRFCWYTDWATVLTPYTGQVHENKLYLGAYNGKKMPLYFCPSNNYLMTYFAGYMVNARIVGGGAKGAAMRCQVKQPSATVLMTEPGPNSVNVNYFDSSFSSASHLLEPGCRIAWCHINNANVLFVDGHVVPYRRYTLPYEMVYTGIVLPDL